MKKLFLMVAMAIFVTGVLRAQEVKYQGEINLGYSVGAGNLAADRVNFHTIHGVKFGEHISAGAGIGIDSYFKDAFSTSSKEHFLPVYLNLKYYFFDKKITPYLSLDTGYSFGISKGTKDYSGLYMTPSFGIKIDMLNIQLGYNLNSISESNAAINMEAVQIKIGFIF